MKLPNLKGSDKFETAENISILFIVLGVLIFSLGAAMTIVSETGISAIFAMFGTLISFLFSVVLILVWLVKEFKSG